MVPTAWSQLHGPNYMVPPTTWSQLHGPNYMVPLTTWSHQLHGPTDYMDPTPWSQLHGPTNSMVPTPWSQLHGPTNSMVPTTWSQLHGPNFMVPPTPWSQLLYFFGRSCFYFQSIVWESIFINVSGIDTGYQRFAAFWQKFCKSLIWIVCSRAPGGKLKFSPQSGTRDKNNFK